MHIPKDIRHFKMDQANTAGRPVVLAPFRVHRIALDSLYKTLDYGMYFSRRLYSHMDVSKDIKTPAHEKENSYGSWYLPVTSFDGYNVLLIENMCEASLEAMANKARNQEYIDCMMRESWVEPIQAFGLDQVKLLKLTTKGIGQFRSACTAMERYDLLIKIRDFIQWAEITNEELR